MAVWATRDRAEAAEAEVERLKGVLASLVDQVRLIPDHSADGYEWDWSCAYRQDYVGATFPNCDPNESDHNDELISRRRVLELLKVK